MLCASHTVHLVALHKAFVLLLNCCRSCSVGPNVVIQIPAQVFIKHCSQEVVLFIIVFLHEKKKEAEKEKCQIMIWLVYLFYNLVMVKGDVSMTLSCLAAVAFLPAPCRLLFILIMLI